MPSIYFAEATFRLSRWMSRLSRSFFSFLEKLFSTSRVTRSSHAACAEDVGVCSTGSALITGASCSSSCSLSLLATTSASVSSFDLPYRGHALSVFEWPHFLHFRQRMFLLFEEKNQKLRNYKMMKFDFIWRLYVPSFNNLVLNHFWTLWGFGVFSTKFSFFLELHGRVLTL